MYRVGSDKDSIQHAKLWLFHWRTPIGEQLQITISSTNLTSDAFHGQQQAGWSICLALEDELVRGKPHAALCDFIEALGKSGQCTSVTEHYIGLLERCSGIPGSHYITSVPYQGLPAAQRKLLAQGTAAKSGKLRILTPSIGNWDDINDLKAWCKMMGTTPEKVELVWPSASHSWIGNPTTLDADNWKMPVNVPDVLTMAKVKRLDVPDPSDCAIFSDGLVGDNRWCHAKLYEYPHGLMLGSHNWSKAAWGLPTGQAAQNFELSVFVEGHKLAISHTTMKSDFSDVALMERAERDMGDYWLAWAHAVRDTNELMCSFRLAIDCTARVEWHDGQKWHTFPPIRGKDKRWQAVLPLNGAEPMQVRLTCCDQEQEYFVLPIIDLRAGPPSPVGIPAELQALAEDMELELYGGPPAIPGKGAGRKNGRPKNPADNADYSIDWLLSARRWRCVVEDWRSNKLDHPNELYHSIGARLAASLDRKAEGDPGAAIASEELYLLLSMAQSW
jgi:hypothetical protein